MLSLFLYYGNHGSLNQHVNLLGPTLLRKIKLAVVSMNDHVFLHNQFVIGIADDDLVQKWEKELTDWEEDHQKPNPFEASFKSMFTQ